MKITFPINSQKSVVPIFWLSFSLLIFTACLGGGGGDSAPAITGDTTQLELNASGELVCNEACYQWGQCGDRVDNGAKVVLAAQGGPAVISQELIFPHNTPVVIAGHEIRSLRPIAGGDVMPMNFYYVNATDGSNKGGWVAGWCVQTGVQ